MNDDGEKVLQLFTVLRRSEIMDLSNTIDVQDICKKYSPNTAEYIKRLKEDENEPDYNAFYDKISSYWLQENLVPEDWKTEIIPGLTLHEALSKIIPEAIELKDKKTPSNS